MSSPSCGVGIHDFLLPRCRPRFQRGLDRQLVLLDWRTCLLGAALTLPGIAGIVLTIGMAVMPTCSSTSASVKKCGGRPDGALKEGYAKAYSAIIDANITTLLTAFVLYSSAVARTRLRDDDHRYFHLLFSAVVLTRLIFFASRTRRTISTPKRPRTGSPTRRSTSLETAVAFTR